MRPLFHGPLQGPDAASIATGATGPGAAGSLVVLPPAGRGCAEQKAGDPKRSGFRQMRDISGKQLPTVIGWCSHFAGAAVTHAIHDGQKGDVLATGDVPEFAVDPPDFGDERVFESAQAIGHDGPEQGNRRQCAFPLRDATHDDDVRAGAQLLDCFNCSFKPGTTSG